MAIGSVGPPESMNLSALFESRSGGRPDPPPTAPEPPSRSNAITPPHPTPAEGPRFPRPPLPPRPLPVASCIAYRCQTLTQQCYRDIIRPASGIKNERIANESHPTICAFRCAGFVDPCRVQARFGRAAPREGQRIRQPVEVERGGRGVRRFPPSRSVAGRALGAKGICPPAAQAVRRGREGNVEACRYAHRSTEEGDRKSVV